MPIPARKAEHLTIAAGSGVEHQSGTGLDAVRLAHRALPGRDLSSVTLESSDVGMVPGSAVIGSSPPWPRPG